MLLNQIPVGGSLRVTGRATTPWLPLPASGAGSFWVALLSHQTIPGPKAYAQVPPRSVIQQVFIQLLLCARPHAIGAYVLTGGTDKDSDGQNSTY